MSEEIEYAVPYEILIDNVLPFLSAKELCAVALVNKQFNKLCQENIVWKQVFENEFHKHLEVVSEDEDMPAPSYDFEEKLREENFTFKDLCKHKLEIDQKIKEVVQERIEVRFYGGSGLGVFERLPMMNIEKITDNKILEFKLEDIGQGKRLKSPFGVLSYPLKIGKMSNLIRGPKTDPDGHNCWLNALLAFIPSFTPLVNLIMKSEFENSLGKSLKQFYNFWLGQSDDSAEDWREKFEFLYGRVWLQFQTLGFQYGKDYSVIDASQILLKELNINYDNFKGYLLSTSEEIPKGYQLKSSINHEVLAYTKDGSPIGHFTTYSKNEIGTFYYDDILQLKGDYQGGMVESDELIKSNPQISLYQAYDCKDEIELGNLEEISIENPKVPENQSIQFTKEKKYSIDEILHLVHLIRFGCQYNDFSFEKSPIQVIKGNSLKSSDSKKVLLRKELELILKSNNSQYGFYLICKFNLFSSIFDCNQDITLDLMKCVQNVKTTLYSFLKEFEQFHILKRKNRKWRKVPLCDHFLSQLFYSKKEISLLKNQ